ncbi:MAG: hypothetical protein ACRCXN_09155 [Bacteroidales bacterium]
MTTRWRWSETSQAPSGHCPDDPYQIYEFWSNSSEVMSKITIFHISTPVGGAAPKHCIMPQVMLVMTCTKFGLNMSKHCRDTASRVIFASHLKFFAPVYENGLTYRLEIHNFLSAWSEDDTVQFW